MSEKRYFYTDPLAGAWMAKHHGFVFEETFVLDIEIARGKAPNEQNAWFDGKAHVQSKCLHLLKPQEGDLIQVWFSSPAIAGPLATDHFVLGCPWEEAEFELEYEDHRVIQRNGTAFMWPEREP